MKNKWFLPAVAAVIVIALSVLSSKGKQPPVMPGDAVHAGHVTNESCLPCHGPGKSSPLKEKHPPKEQCVYCHKPGKDS